MQVTSLGWFGFAADPPTLAHRAAADAALGSGLVEKVVAFPAGNLDYKSFQASDEQRIEMLRLWHDAAGFEDEVIVSHFDLDRAEAYRWIDIWRKINDLAPSIKHYLICGSDQYMRIAETWKNGSELLEKARFLVVPRKSFEAKNLYPNTCLIDIDPIPGSSTEARQGDLTQLDENVRAYILTEQLYLKHDTN